MITRLDHTVLICPDIEAGIHSYTVLLGREPDWVSEDAKGGTATALFRVENTALEIMAPAGEGAVGARLRQILQESGPRLTSLAFASDDLDADHRMMTRRALSPGESGSHASEDKTGKGLRYWKSYRCPDAACAGVKTFILQHSVMQKMKEIVPMLNKSHVHALDHLVINTPNPARAVAHYGSRLGLDFRLDRTAEQWKTRFMFFRLGGLTLEVIHRLDMEHDSDADDTIWGLTWAVADLGAAHERLRAIGLTVSDIRKGRKPGSAVFTVKDGTLGIPTLFIAHEAEAA